MLDLDTDPTPGDPFGIRELARAMAALSADAADAAVRVRRAAEADAVQSWVGASGDAYRQQIGAFPGDLEKLSASYGMAGRALAGYAVSLDDAQGQAGTALSRGREAYARLTSAQAALSSARTGEADAARAVNTVTMAPVPVPGVGGPVAPDPTAVSAAIRNHAAAQTRLAQAQAATSDAQSDLDAARRLALAAKGLREQAEDTASHALHAASHAGIQNKHWWQKLDDGLAKGWHALVEVAKVVVLVLGVIALIVGGPLAWVVFAAALVVLTDTLVKYGEGKASLWDVALAALACIPMTKGLTSIGEIRTVLAGGEGLLGVGRLVVAGGRTQLADMASMVRGMARGLTTVGKGLPGALADTVRLSEAATPDGARILTMTADPAPLHDLLSAAAADARGAGGGAVAWTGEDGLTLTAEQNAAADAYLARAARAEPGIRTALSGTLSDVPSASIENGLPHVLKEPDSLKRKVATVLAGAPEKPMEELLGGIKDSVRYSAEIPSLSYTQGVTTIVGDMRSAGFQQIGQFKNSWAGPGYKGINSFWADPSTGHVFELQFHTPESFYAKMVTHDLYKRARLPGTPLDVAEELDRQQDEIFSRVPLPPGVIDFR